MKQKKEAVERHLGVDDVGAVESPGGRGRGQGGAEVRDQGAAHEVLGQIVVRRQAPGDDAVGGGERGGCRPEEDDRGCQVTDG